jgi:TolA-binding protein
MLQVRLLLRLLFITAVCNIGASEEFKVPSVEWILEDAFNEELLPLSEAVFVMPAEVNQAFELYKNGKYQKTIEILDKVRKLELPDGRLDFISFMLAESYRKERLTEKANNEYEFITRRFPNSDKVPPCIFRLLDIKIENEDIEGADTLYHLFKQQYSRHPLMSAATYSYGKYYYKINRFQDAIKTLNEINQTSSRYYQALFVEGLCHVKLKEYDNAISRLKLVNSNIKSKKYVDETSILLGDIYYLKGDLKTALEYYKAIPEDAGRYNYVAVKMARLLIDMKNYDMARDLAEKFLKNNKQNEYYFELITILEQAYAKLNDEINSEKVSFIIQKEITNARLLFEIYEEKDRLTDLLRTCQIMEYDGIRYNKKELLDVSQKARKKIGELDSRIFKLLAEIDNENIDNKKPLQISNFAERRYLNMLKNQLARYDDSILDLKGQLELKFIQMKNNKNDSVAKNEYDKSDEKFKQLVEKMTELNNEHDLVIRECLGTDYTGKRVDEELQTKFIDWSFVKYQDRKINQRKYAEEMASLKKNKVGSSDSLIKNKAIAIEKLTKALVSDRKHLINHTEKMLDVYPKNKFVAPILLRLAELYYDEAGDEFQKKLRDYEQKIAENTDTANLLFPEYDLSNVIGLYEKIVLDYNNSEVADDALFYKARALQKEGSEEDANNTFIELVERYPESEYYVESNMNIGQYYFEHPKTDENNGYKLAEDAYRRVLYYRDHPQYVQALYHLGWCYYMQDRFEEAIAVFKYLIEDNRLNFDPSQQEENQIHNPLLRAEAIDYIAISFDEENRIDDAIKFLKLIGNDDYAAMVIKRIAQLREEDLDFAIAAKVYTRLVREYPLSMAAPDAAVGLIKIFDSKDKSDSAMAEREQFFTMYSRGSKWQERVAKKDSMQLKRVDSIAIAIGIYVADNKFKIAENSNDLDAYKLSAEKYQLVVDKYPNVAKAADAHWNIAVIMDTKLNKKPYAYKQYLEFSQMKELDSVRREQAALNALAIAQALLPPDSAIKQSEIDFAASKVIEAAENYINHFPSGKSYGSVLLSSGAVYFNRKLFRQAETIYTKIIEKGSSCKEFFEALLFVGQCNFGEENWDSAITSFVKVWKQADNEAYRMTAYKFLLQSEYLLAKSYLTKEEYLKAADAFRSIDEKYPGSEYSDVALFNAAEAYEKKEQWIKATESYYDIVNRYPNSKLAADALFNAASDFEKADKFTKSAEAYELIVNKYGQSDKAKDALFNLTFCYEKLGQMDKMAETNERYSAMYPGEKDVETMLLRSAAFYVKSKMYDRGINVYKNFIRRFPRSPKTIEALYMIAKCHFDQNDKENALLGYNQTEQQNVKFSQDGLEANNYYASEAAYQTAMLKREKFLDVKLVLPHDVLKKAAKEKSDYLADASKAFQRVIQYQSDKMFEAAYRMGELYQDMAIAWRNQERSRADEIKSAVMEKDILTVASQLMQKTIVPYRKAIDLAVGFDSLSIEHRQWINKSRENLTSNCYQAGMLLSKSIGAMENAPVPKEIQEKPLHHFQYLKQVLETVMPMKENVIQYYFGAINLLDTLKIADSNADSCKNAYCQYSFLIANNYENLADFILKKSKDLPGNLTDAEKEDLVFQLEDIVFELQDKAIAEYEDRLQMVETSKLTSNPCYVKILESLARLQPDKYGKTFYVTKEIKSDLDWIVRTDSVSGWNSGAIAEQGWSSAAKKIAGNTKGGLNSVMIGNSSNSDRYYLWKHVFVNGIPRNASVYMQTPGMYNLFVNGSLVLKDTVGKRNFWKVDSATGITSLLKGGDNVIAVSVINPDTNSGIKFVASILIDTTQKFTSKIKLPAVVNTVSTIDKSIDSISLYNPTTDALSSGNKSDPNKTAALSIEYKNSKEINDAIQNFVLKEQNALNECKKERLTIQKLRIELDEIDRKMSQKKLEKKLDIPDASTPAVKQP